MNWAPLPEGPFDLIAADPNWKYVTFSDKGLGRAPDRHYATASIDEICALPVGDVAASNSFLMLWINGPSLIAGYHVPVMKAWGFKPSAMAFVWVKNNRHIRVDLSEGEYLMKPGNVVRFNKQISSSDFYRGLGYTTRQNAEFVLLGRRGRPRRADKSIGQIICAPRREHSRKPDEFFDRAARYAGPDARKLELFSRQQRAGWSVWGNEVNKFAEAAE